MKKLILGFLSLIIAGLIALFYSKTSVYYAFIAVLLVIGISLVIIGVVEILPDNTKKSKDHK